MAIIDLNSRQEPSYFSSEVAFARRFFRHDEAPAEDVGFLVTAGGTETCLPGYQVDRRDFPFWAVEFVSSGRGTVLLNRRIFPLKTGSVFAYAPGMSHRITADAVYPLKKQFVDFLPAKIPPASYEVLSRRLIGRVLHSHAPDPLRRSFDDLLEFGSRNSPESRRICSQLVDLLLMKIAEDASDTELAESPSYLSYRRCLDIVDQRFLEFSTAAEVADAANMDVSYLCRLFRKYGDETPYRRLTRRKMNYAAGLLTREGMSVSRTAAELGYEDAFTFSRRFKTYMGLSPRSFVENTRSGGGTSET